MDSKPDLTISDVALHRDLIIFRMHHVQPQDREKRSFSHRELDGTNHGFIDASDDNTFTALKNASVSESSYNDFVDTYNEGYVAPEIRVNGQFWMAEDPEERGHCLSTNHNSTPYRDIGNSGDLNSGRQFMPIDQMSKKEFAITFCVQDRDIEEVTPSYACKLSCDKDGPESRWSVYSNPMDMIKHQTSEFDGIYSRKMWYLPNLYRFESAPDGYEGIDLILHNEFSETGKAYLLEEWGNKNGSFHKYMSSPDDVDGFNEYLMNHVHSFKGIALATDDYKRAFESITDGKLPAKITLASSEIRLDMGNLSLSARYREDNALSAQAKIAKIERFALNVLNADRVDFDAHAAPVIGTGDSSYEMVLASHTPPQRLSMTN